MILIGGNEVYLFIINPRAGGGAGSKVWQRAERLLKSRGTPYRSLFTASAEEAGAQIMEALAERTDWAAAVVVGGDGTVHSALPALRASGVPLGVIPAGSGNDTARGFRIPREPEAAVELALAATPVPADLLAGGGGCSLTAIASGFDAAVAENVNASLYKRLCNAVKAGRLAYLIGVIHTLITYRTSRVTVTCDGQEQTYDNAWLVAVCGLPSYGGGLPICPQASADDGLLDVCVVHGCGRLRLLRLLPRLLRGSHVTLPYVAMLRGRSVTAAFAEPRPVIGDGERLGAQPLAVRCEPAALRVLAGPAALQPPEAAAKPHAAAGPHAAEPGGRGGR